MKQLIVVGHKSTYQSWMFYPITPLWQHWITHRQMDIWSYKRVTMISDESCESAFSVAILKELVKVKARNLVQSVTAVEHWGQWSICERETTHKIRTAASGTCLGHGWRSLHKPKQTTDRSPRKLDDMSEWKLSSFKKVNLLWVNLDHHSYGKLDSVTSRIWWMNLGKQQLISR